MPNDELLVALRNALAQAREGVARATEQLAALEQRAAPKTAESDVTGSLKAMHSLSQKETDKLGEVRQKGQGPGLYKAIDEAAALEQQRTELVKNAIDQGHHGGLDEVLTKLTELASQQRQILLDELGKFEAQGLHKHLEQLTRLAEQQRAAVEQLMQTRRAT